MAITNLPPVAEAAAAQFTLVVTAEYTRKQGAMPDLGANRIVGSGDRLVSPIGPVVGMGTNDLAIS